MIFSFALSDDHERTELVPGFLAAPAKFETEIRREIFAVWLELACLWCHERCKLGPTCADFQRTSRRIPAGKDCVAEREGFEPSYMDPAPVASRSID